ncbi:AAA family ATPase [Vulgatibacter incomptus]|uniref:MoxR-like ATPase n=1 Tax=Vulgatibacter incomptus TaxID=1391653 RepID=A0A0K1PEC4_9BACT|nr:AAA family ATPase [Vulgatibacter incomptus]AKU91847.1 MoxR-like ATPase [Vulgatibacter incomptus]
MESKPKRVLDLIRSELSASFFERDDVIEGLLCALVAGQHVLLLGPPGTAKSELAHELCQRIEGADYFQWLLTRFTTTEELFGPISLKGLEQDRYLRVTAGKLPRAHIAFLDEVFKASSSILNTLLTILNERRFDGGDGPSKVPLLSLVGAANELPEDEELSALYDRFLLRYQVEYLAEDFRFLQMLRAGPPAVRSTLRLDELTELRANAAAVEVPGEILQDLATLRRILFDKDVVASDRRYRLSLELLRARAAIHGRAKVTSDDLALLSHVLWTEPDDKGAVEEALRLVSRGHEDEVEKLLFQAREVAESAQGPHEDEEIADRASVEALSKLHDLARKVDSIVDEARGRGRALEKVSAMREELRRLVRQLLAEDGSREAESRH